MFAFGTDVRGGCTAARMSHRARGNAGNIRSGNGAVARDTNATAAEAVLRASRTQRLRRSDTTAPACRGGAGVTGSSTSGRTAGGCVTRRRWRASTRSRSRRPGSRSGSRRGRTGTFRRSAPTRPGGASTCITSAGACAATARSSAAWSSSRGRSRGLRRKVQARPAGPKPHAGARAGLRRAPARPRVHPLRRQRVRGQRVVRPGHAAPRARRRATQRPHRAEVPRQGRRAATPQLGRSGRRQGAPGAEGAERRR